MDITLIPESAPFNAEQRAWLNGFLAGWLGVQSGTTVPPAPDRPDATTSMPAEAAATDEPEPWHDPALSLEERLTHADGKPLSKRLMAAMAQLDCGSCGYVCKTYAEAIATGAEPRLSLCSPGGTETARALKRLLKEQAAAPSLTPTDAVAVKPNSSLDSDSGTRENPYEARVVQSIRLNGEGSEKEIRHVEIALGTTGPSYAVGDSLGVYPENDPALVEAVIGALGSNGEIIVRTADGAETSLRGALGRACCLAEITEPLLGLLAEAAADAGEAAELRALVDDDRAIQGDDVLDLMERYPSARKRVAPDRFVAALAAMRPRLYSISSSPKRHRGEVHLTVRRVSYVHRGRMRHGVASTMLAQRIAAGSPLRVFVQKSHGFTLPADPSTPIIMIGPVTGIAPFRAFLHEREALGISGKAWLFFGDQRSAHDFLYEQELMTLLRNGVLTRLDTAFSRDQEHKVYVQDRVLEHGADLFAWLEEGARLYVCGDAKRMAADVDRAIREVVCRHGGRSEASAATCVSELVKEGRYFKDVY